VPPAGLLVFAESIPLTLKMEAICSSEMSVVTQQTTRRHIPGDCTLQEQTCFQNIFLQLCSKSFVVFLQYKATKIIICRNIIVHFLSVCDKLVADSEGGTHPGYTNLIVPATITENSTI
jgi:hypothetical protein